MEQKIFVDINRLKEIINSTSKDIFLSSLNELINLDFGIVYYNNTITYQESKKTYVRFDDFKEWIDSGCTPEYKGEEIKLA